MGDRLRAIGHTALIAALDADQHEEIVGGMHVRYEIDAVTGLAMAPDRVLPHMGCVMEVGSRVEGIEREDLIVMQRAKSGHRLTFLYGGQRWQVLSCAEKYTVPGIWADDRFEAGPGRMLVTPEVVDVYTEDTGGIRKGVVTSSDVDGITADDRVWWADGIGTSWTAEGAEYVSLTEADALCVEVV